MARLSYAVLVVSLALLGCAGGSMLAEGKAAPALAAHAIKDIQGQPTDLDQLRQQGPVVLVFLRGFS